MTPRDSANPDSYKVRRAKVGGYRDYFDDEQVARIDELVRSKLSPLYGYAGEARLGAVRRKEARREALRLHPHQRRQRLGALVAAHALRRNSRHADDFDVRIIQREDYRLLRRARGPALPARRRAGASGATTICSRSRRCASCRPSCMGYQGRALVIDPDIFAVGDVMRAALARHAGQGDPVPPPLGLEEEDVLRVERHAARLRAADALALRADFDALFEGKRDYADWICLRLEPPESIGLLEDEWNDFDR